MSLRHFSKVFRTDKFAEWGFDKGDGEGHNYVGLFYDSICVPMRDTATAILEIGVHNGYSHLLWSAFFQNAQIYGCEWMQAPYPDHNRIHIVNMDAYQQSTADYFKQLEPNGYDMIIDDGSHIPDHQSAFIHYYWGLLKVGKFMVIEDIIGDDPAKYVIDVANKYGPTFVVESPFKGVGHTMRAVVIQKVN